MTNTNDPAQELKALRSLLQSHERRVDTQAARWDDMLSKIPEWKRQDLIERIEKQKARNDNQTFSLRGRIAILEEQIARQAEEARQQEAKRAWLKPIKAQALESWLRSGGTAAGFESSWPEMERKILMQNTLESLAIEQPDDSRAGTKRQDPAVVKTGQRRGWNDRKFPPPVDPKKKRH